jgi:predicted ATPase/class 3 adenylate cyclase
MLALRGVCDRRYGWCVSGVHAFLITDLVASTRGWQADAVGMATLLERHDGILAAAIAARDGTVFKHTGDGMCAVFVDPAAAVAAAIDAQRSMVTGGMLVRMGIHVGVDVNRGDDFFGLSVNRCARITEAAHGGQILLSLAAEEVVRDALPAGASLLSVGEVRLRDLGHDDQLFQLVAPGLPHQFPPPRSVGRPSVRFAAARRPLVGRTTELRDLEQLLTAGRAVTVVGGGGCGKTRMVLEVLSRRAHDGDPVAFADLSAITDPSLVTTAVADAVDMPPGGELDSNISVTRFLADRTLLLVLDNCEHVLAAASDLVEDVLSVCSHVSLLATSREPLGVDGEMVWRLPSLTAEDATALFVERAIEAGAPRFRDADFAVIEEICARLDGIPLALELAATQAVHLSLPRVRDLLEDRFRLLVGGSRRALPRHRTLEATMTWSYELLHDDEKHLLRHLAVFTGGFTIEAAAFVAGAPGETLTTTAHRLGALHHKSLVAFDSESGRYRLLETVRSFGRLRLAEANETDTANTRLYDWLVAQAPGPWRYSFESGDDVAVELDNLRTALDWCAASGRRGAAAGLAAAYGPMWFSTVRGGEGLAWMVLASEVDETLPLDARLAWRTASTWAAFAAFDVERQRAVHDHLRLVPDGHPAFCPLLFVKAWTKTSTDRPEARRLLAGVRAAAGHDASWTANCDHLEALTWLIDGHIDEAIALLGHAVELNERSGVSQARMYMALALHLAGRHDDVTSVVAELHLDKAPRGGYWGDLTAGVIAVIEAVGRSDLLAARGALAELLTTTARRYPHVETAAGFGVQAAAIVAWLAGRPDESLTLLAGSRRHRLHLRFEGTNALGRVYLGRCRAAVTTLIASEATKRGEAMSIDALVALATRIAAGVD